MQRSEIRELMAQLKRLGMRGAYEEVMATALMRQCETGCGSIPLSVAAGSPGARSIGCGLGLLRLQPFVRRCRVRGMENLKLALRLRLRSGPVDQRTAETIAAALDAAAQTVERS